MKGWLAGLFVVLLLIGTCGTDDRADTGGAERDEAAPLLEESGAADRAAAREARRQQRIRRAAQARRARVRRARARRAAAVAAAEAERRAAEEAAAAEAAAAEEASSSCDSNYTGACLDPNSSDYDCEGGSGDGPDYTGMVNSVGSDPYDLDRDGDGIACDP